MGFIIEGVFFSPKLGLVALSIPFCTRGQQSSYELVLRSSMKTSQGLRGRIVQILLDYVLVLLKLKLWCARPAGPASHVNMFMLN